MLDLANGSKLVKLARSSVEKHINKGKFSLEKIEDEKLNEKNGVFVTIENFPDNSLRGCIGFPSTKMPLWESVQKAACSAAFQDPRFQPLKQEELNNVVFEVSVMTNPELIEVKNPKEYLKKIEVGKDGLILQCERFGGLLLPQVPVQFNWSAEEFLENLCYKAGLTPDWIYNEKTRIWKFQCQIFAEKEPRGKIVEVKL